MLGQLNVNRRWRLIGALMGVACLAAGCAQRDAADGAVADSGGRTQPPRPGKAKPGVAESMVAAVAAGKPGAPVDLRFEIAERPRAGSPVSIRIAVTSRGSDVDMLQVMFQSTEGIDVTGGGEMARIERPKDGETLTHDVTVVPQRDGVFYLSAVALIEGKAGSLARSFAIPLIVGDSVAVANAVAAKTGRSSERDAAGQAIESMPASGNP